MSKNVRSAEVITKSSNSNLAFALHCLPKERRADLVTFYAFCRIIDDIADDLLMPVEEKQRGFDHWKNGLREGFSDPGEIEREVIEIRDRHGIPTELFLDLIKGCEMDLKPMRFGTWEDLQDYTYRVACVVGLISLYLFGADPERSRKYALKLGHALQLTNIIRDVGEDLDNGLRIYLPLADLGRFQYTERDLVGKVYDGRFQAMMRYQCERAKGLYEEASNCLPKEDEKALKAAKIMADIYHNLLHKIEQQNYAVFHQRVSISKFKKASFLLKGMLS